MRKIKIISLMLFSMLIFSGCSVNKSTEVDKVTQQKNITKIQNNINEIMGKDYSYVRFNLGRPYATTYYVNLDNYNEVNDIDLGTLEKNIDVQMIYPKEGYECSALYLQLSNNEVVSVRTDSFVGNTSVNKSKTNYTDDYDVLIDFYERESEIRESNIDKSNLDKYINKSINILNLDLGVSTPNIIAYSKNKDKAINIYLIKNSKGNTESALIATEGKDKIDRISIENDENIIDKMIREFK